MYRQLVITILFIFFPILIQVGGFDAITTGTLFIYLLFVHYLIKRPNIFTRTYFSRSVCLLLIVGLVSTLSIENAFLASSFRRFLASSAGILLFFMVININMGLVYQEQRRRIEFLIFLVLVMYAVQILVGVAIYYAPQMGEYLSIFTTRDVETIETFVTGGVKRMRSIMVGQETLGEVIPLLTPLVLYKILAQKKKGYYVILALLFVGVALSATRSGFLLFFTAALLFLLLNLSLVKLPTWIGFVAAATLMTFAVLLYFPGLVEPVIERLGDFVSDYEDTGSVVAAANRVGVWGYIEIVLMPNISLFGNGFLSIHDGQPFDFHNLYATVVHRFGVIGFIVFFYIFFKVSVSLNRVKKRVQSPGDRALLYACLISILMLLLNEVKFDFIRQASYQQTVWLMLGIFYLVYLCMLQKYTGSSLQSKATARPLLQRFHN